ncbi:MAG: ABC transporter permease subunit [Desulfobacter sp.]|nr:MAG: ABC transporter permease subunit [Desulfobacter sp.]
MHRLTWFRLVLITLPIILTAILLAAIISLVLVPSPGEIWASLLSKEMLFSLKLTVWTSLLSTFLVFIVSVPTGYSLSRIDFWGKSIVKAIIDLPIAFPELVLGLCLLLLFGHPVIQESLRAIGLDFVFTKQGIVIAQFFTALPYAVRIIKSTFDFINPRLEFVSRSLRYSMFETFINVSLPLAKNGLLTATIIAFARSIGTFGTVLILAGGSYMQTEVLPITLYLNVSYGNMPMAITSGIILVIVSFIAILVFEKSEASI